MKKIIVLFLCITIFTVFSQAQVSFSNETVTLGMQGFHSGVAIAVTDINGDGLDDIAHMDEGTYLYIEYQQLDGSFTRVDVGNLAGSSQWSMCVGDMDNNGISDVFAGGAYDGIKTARANSDGSAFTTGSLPDDNLFIQGSNFADINNDGWVDIFACHDDAESRIWGNDGTGQYVTADDWIDMSIGSGSEINSGNYGSVWCDVDYDGDLDLYIAKCRQGVNDPSDPRRINVLYENDGFGNFEEKGSLYNLDNGAQSWTADFADIDNDGDWDCFITNHDVPSQLLRNDGGVFVDITVASGLNVAGFPIQGLMEDFDNDGFVDILVAGSEGQVFHNNGDGTFTELPDMFDDNAMESFAVGDLNSDGFLDVYGGYANVFTSPSSIDDALWINKANSGNHFVTVNLTGTISNNDAIGAKVELYGAWGKQIREVRAGESYGIVNSFNQHFGIGLETAVDSLVILWPSGIREVKENPPVDLLLSYVELNCSITANITPDGDTDLCPGENVTLAAPSGYSYVWSSGETSQSISVNTGGIYGLTITDDSGCPGFASIAITETEEVAPEITADNSIRFCNGESVTLTATTSDAYDWSSGDSGQSIVVTESGTFSVSVPGACSGTILTSESIEVEVFTADLATPGPNQTIGSPQAVTLTATGDNLHWYDMETGGALLETGPTYTTPILSEGATYWIENRSSFLGELLNGGSLEHQGNDYSGNQYNGILYFDVLEEFTLKSVTVFTEFFGERNIQIIAPGGGVFASKLVDVNQTEQVIELDVVIPPGNGYSMTTETSVNESNFGTTSPQLKRSDAGVSYPYLIPDVLNIYDSNYGEEFYYYFYDWKVETDGLECPADRVSIDVIFDTSISIDELNDAGIAKVYPNPANDFVVIELGDSDVSVSEVRLYDAIGRRVKNESMIGKDVLELSLRGMPTGIYILELVTGQGGFSKRIVVE